MQSRLAAFTLSLLLAVSLLGCTSKPSDSTSDATTGTSTGAITSTKSKESKMAEKEKEKPAPVVIPAGTSVTVRLGQAVGSKISQPGQTFAATIAAPISVDGKDVVPSGANASGTVTDAKPLGRFAGGAVLQLKLNSISINGADQAVEVATRTYTAKGKGKRTGAMVGGGAGLGAIIGAVAGGGKGAAIGAVAGAGAGTAGTAFTGNKDIVLPAESAITFQLQQPIEVK